MATLHCRHCGGDIDSDARRTQCRECGALFPFECAVCNRNLRSPFPIFDDERYLSLDAANPLPLCPDHFLRKCPDCEKWFQADENPGFFRCGACAEKAQANPSLSPDSDSDWDEPEWDDGGRFEMEPHDDREVRHAAPAMARGRMDSNVLVLGGAAFAFVALVSWFLMSHH